jgi:hypothetical protein
LEDNQFKEVQEGFRKCHGTWEVGVAAAAGLGSETLASAEACRGAGSDGALLPAAATGASLAPESSSLPAALSQAGMLCIARGAHVPAPTFSPPCWAPASRAADCAPTCPKELLTCSLEVLLIV